MPRYGGKVDNAAKFRHPLFLSVDAGRFLLSVGVVLILALSAVGCGGAASTPIGVRVGTVKIDKATVDHWNRAITLGSTVSGPLGRSGETPRQKALGLLISANWAIGAADERNLAISAK